MKSFIKLVVVVLVLWGAWYFLSPLFIDEEVDEALPEAFVTPMPTPEEFEEMTVEEQVEVEKKMVEEFADMPATTTEEMMPPEMLIDSHSENLRTLVKRGEFRDADSFHKGSGSAAIHQFDEMVSHDEQGELQTILRLENLDVTNGPDLHVYLVAHPNPTERSHVSEGEYLDLGQLKGNKGNQNYDIPAGTDLTKYGSVVIYCQPFKVIFSVASLNLIE